MRRKTLLILITGCVLVLCAGASASPGGVSKKTHSSGHAPPKSKIEHPALSPALVNALQRRRGSARSFAGTAPTPALAQPAKRGTGRLAPSVAGDLAAALTQPGTTFAQTASASFVTVPLEGIPDAVSAESFTPNFPIEGGSFAILTTGSAWLASAPSDPTGMGYSDACTPGGACGADGDPTSKGANRQNAHDVTILKIPLVVPKNGGNCLSFDFRFLSEEFPWNSGTPFNDAFVAELDKNTWQANGQNPNAAINAPANFAGDVRGRPISINSVTFAQTTSGAAADTPYTAATPVLRASTPITAGPHTLYLSIFDQVGFGDDSAAFVDGLNLSTAAAGQCAIGAAPDEVPADLSVATSANVVDSGHADHHVAVHNDGPATAYAASFTIDFSGMEYVGANGAECTGPTPFHMTCTLGDLGSGQTADVTIHTTYSSSTAWFPLLTFTQVTSSVFDPTQANNYSSTDDSATGPPPTAAVSDLSVESSAVATPQGSIVMIPVKITNNGPDDYTGSVYTDTYVSKSLSFIGYALPEGEAPSDGFDGCYAVVAGDMSCSFEDSFALANLASFTVDLYAYVVRSGWITTQTNLYSDATDPNYSNNQSLASFGASPTTYGLSNVSVFQTAPDFAPANGVITYTIKATNGGSKEASDVEVEDLLPAETTPVSVSDTLGACGPLTHAGGVDCHIDLKTGQTDTITYKVGVDGGAANGDFIFNTVDAVPTTYYDPSLDDNYWYGYTEVAPGPAEVADLSTKITSPAGPILAGTSITTSATITNKGSSAIQQAEISLRSSLLVTGYVVSMTAGCNLDNFGVGCDVGSLGKGASKTVKIVWYPTTGGGDVIDAYAYSSDLTWEDPYYGNNDSYAPLSVTAPVADLGITMDDAVDPLPKLGIQTYTITVTNENFPGEDAATGVQVVDTLPSSDTLISVSGKGFSCVANAVITCSLKVSLPAGTSATLTLVARLNSEGSTTVNTASVGSWSYDFDPNDNTASALTTLTVT